MGTSKHRAQQSGQQQNVGIKGGNRGGGGRVAAAVSALSGAKC